MKPPLSFLMAGGGTGGHVIPALAVARELRRRGHQPFFVGTRRGLEARLVPAEGFPIEWIEIGGLKSVGRMQTLRTLWQLPRACWQCLRLMNARRPRAVFSMGGYAAGPAMLAAWLKWIPIVVMEPNAMPGFTSRRMARLVARALISFEESARYFPPGRTVLTGLPVRSEFFALPPKPPSDTLSVLITGGSQGSCTLNLAAHASWPLFRQAGFPIRFLHQTGPAMFRELEAAFAASGLEGRIVAFIQDMPAAFAEADLVVCRSGAGAVAELAAAGKPSILVPFPFAADDHQLRNAGAFERTGAARLLPDRETTGERLFHEITKLAAEPGALQKMAASARSLAHPGAAEKAADILERLADFPIDIGAGSRNNTI
jgi:UDP-N-acetylglucosamine--N-acetylmuramyl-(pentapeptide) pyrophosphoryl-undecaprenol N-acetylglucosamine transferase